MLLEVCSGCDLAAKSGRFASMLCCAALSMQGLSVLMQVREEEQNELKTDFDDSEHIETFLVPKDGLMRFLEEQTANGIKIDSKVLAYAIGSNR